MKLIQIACYIKLPDDFTGDETDALEWYVNYRRNTDKQKIDGDEFNKEDSFNNVMDHFYDTLVENGATRAGTICLNEFNEQENKFEMKDRIE